MKTFIRLITGFVVLFPFGVSAQEALSLEEALQRAETNNRSIKTARLEAKIAEADYKKSRALFLPSITLSENFVNTNDPLQSFGLKLKQETVTQEDFAPSELNDPDRITNFNTRIQVMQPLVNVDGFYKRKAAQNIQQAKTYAAERAAFHIKYEVKKAYFGAQLAFQSQAVLEKALEAARANLNLAQANVEAGYAKETDVTAVRVHILEIENRLAEAKAGYADAIDFLRFLLNEENQITLTDTLAFSDMPAEVAQTENAEVRTFERLAREAGLQARQEMLRADKMSFLPNLNAFAAHEWNSQNFLGTEADNNIIGVSVTWNVFAGGEKWANLQKARAETDRDRNDYENYLAQTDLRISRAKRALLLAFEKIRIAELAVSHAEEAYRIRVDRYAEGLEKTSDLLTGEAQTAEKRLQRLSALYEYKKALFELELLTETSWNK